jgi:general secretion pathway protein D
MTVHETKRAKIANFGVTQIMMHRTILTVIMALTMLGLCPAGSRAQNLEALADLDIDLLDLDALLGVPPARAAEQPAEPVQDPPAVEPDAVDLGDVDFGEAIPDNDDLLPEAVPEPDLAPAPAAPAPDFAPEPRPELDFEFEPAPPAVVPQPVVPTPMPPPAPTRAPDPVAEPEATPPAVRTDSPRDILIAEVETLEALRRQALQRHGEDSLRRARQALSAGRFEEAQGFFENALQHIPDLPDNRRLREEARDGVAESLYRRAMILDQRGELPNALELAKNARDLRHPRADALVSSLEQRIESPPPPPPPPMLARWQETGYQANQEDINRRLRRARQFYITGEFSRARGEIEIVLRDNPFHRDAIDLLEKVGQRMYDVSAAEYEATRTRMIRDVRSTWNPRIYAIDTIQIDDPGTVDFVPMRTTIDTAERRIRSKLEAIILPEVNFRGANIYDVVEFLTNASVEYDDPELPIEQRGVNFILRIPGESAEQPAEPDDPFAPAVTPRATGAGRVPLITFNARHLPLFDVLRVVMDVGGLRYRITDNVVMIVPASEREDDFIHRMYDVLPTLQEIVQSVGRELATTQPRRQDPFGALEPATDLRGGAGSDEWKRFFSELGVRWPDGSAISYLSTIGKLKVANTPANLAELETILMALNVTPRQIEIEARFVEVSQTDLESLGFEWLLNDDWQVLRHRADMGLPLQSQRRVEVGATAGGFTSGNRFFSNQGLPGGTTRADDILHVASVLTNPELSFVLHALNQRANTDLLSAPKIVTRSGNEATIKVVTEYIYPTEFRVEGLQAEGQTGTATTTAAVVEPTGFEMREVGVILQVLPEVSTDGQMINLVMSPRVVSEPEWRNYGSRYPDPITGQYIELPMEQPFFPVRSVMTSISIYNGATVVMGGMITEVRQEIDDRIPFLGDIPILGRLFRSKFERSEKRNLLIFVTARLVDPAGRVLQQMPDTMMLGGAMGEIDTMQGVP